MHDRLIFIKGDPCSGAVRGVVSGVARIESVTGDTVCCGAAVYDAVDGGGVSGGVVGGRISGSSVGGS